MGNMAGINLNKLSELAKANPRYAKMLGGLSSIDSTVKKMAGDIVDKHASAPGVYYIKTELMNQCYSLYLFNAERQATAGTTWTLASLLEKCSNYMIEDDISRRVTAMIDKLGETGIHTGDRTNWVD